MSHHHLRQVRRALDRDRRFSRFWVGAVAATVAWEFAHRSGALVFDPLDLAARGIGAVGASGLYLGLRRFSFLPAIV